MPATAQSAAMIQKSLRRKMEESGIFPPALCWGSGAIAQKIAMTRRQAALVMAKKLRQCRNPKKKTARRGIVRMAKEAAVSWKPMALPQFFGLKRDVMRGMAQGK